MTPNDVEANLNICMGRLNALHAFCLALARSMPTATAAAIAPAIQQAFARVEADATASPLPDALVNEMSRVLGELSALVALAAQSQPPGHHRPP